MDTILHFFDLVHIDLHSVNTFLQATLFKVPDPEPTAGSDLLASDVLNSLADLKQQLTQYVGDFVNDAKSLAAVFMLIYFSIKSYGIMTGDEKLEIMPLLRPFAILLVIALWAPFVNLIEAPIVSMEKRAQANYIESIKTMNAAAKTRDKKVRAVLAVYDEMDADINFMYTALDVVTLGKLLPKTDSSASNMSKVLGNKLKIMYVRFNLMIYQYMETFVLFVFRAAFFAIFYIRILIGTILIIIGPLSFAVSILPAFKDSYIKWITKFISVTLYGFFGYLAGLMAMAHVLYALNKEVDYWKNNNFTTASGKQEIISALMANTNGQYYLIVALIVGIVGFLCVPFVAHWIIGSGSTGQVASRAVRNAKKTTSALGTAAAAPFRAVGSVVGTFRGK